LLVWRDGQDKVRFMQISPFAYQLATRLQAGEGADAALLALARQHGLSADTQYFSNAHNLLAEWGRQEIWYSPVT
ncbi:MAG: HvfC family peptide modification chaperone, partial [Pseudomonadales bacterium]